MAFAAAVFVQNGKSYIYGVDAYYDKDTDLVLDEKNKPITGVLKNYEDEKVQWKALYKNGLKEGLQIFYFENGKIMHF
jgi:antitoxin component YwqK of YwqJK toxin-antitoxin module